MMARRLGAMLARLCPACGSFDSRGGTVCSTCDYRRSRAPWRAAPTDLAVYRPAIVGAGATFLGNMALSLSAEAAVVFAGTALGVLATALLIGRGLREIASRAPRFRASSDDGDPLSPRGGTVWAEATFDKRGRLRAAQGHRRAPDATHAPRVVLGADPSAERALLLDLLLLAEGGVVVGCAAGLATWTRRALDEQAPREGWTRGQPQDLVFLAGEEPGDEMLMAWLALDAEQPRPWGDLVRRFLNDADEREVLRKEVEARLGKPARKGAAAEARVRAILGEEEGGEV